MDGVVTIRLMGMDADEVREVALAIESLFKGRCVSSPIFRNTRDAGFRCYLNVKFERRERSEETK